MRNDREPALARRRGMLGRPRIIVGLAAALVAGSWVVGPGAVGQTPPVASAANKIGVVDLAKVFKNYRKSSELEKRINGERDKLKESIDGQRKKIQTLNREMDLLDVESEAYRTKEEEKQIELARFELMKERLQRTIKRRWEQYNLNLLEDIETVVKEYGKKNRFTLIFKVEGEPIEEHKLDKLVQIGLKSVLYFSDPVDITDDVVPILNQRYTVGEKVGEKVGKR